jgi:carbon starvation protein
MGIAIIAVLVASFAATTLDTATRLQRYVVQELGAGMRLRPLSNMYVATAVAVITGGGMAMLPGPKGVGTGGLILWPLFGATNQLLAGLAFLVIVFYLWRRSQPIWFAVIPLAIMIVMPAWAMAWNLFHPVSGWWAQSKHLLFGIGLATMGLQVWMLVEAVLMWPRARGVLEDALPPLAAESGLSASGGRSC